MDTSSCIATFALRMRVSMSASGSVIVIGASLPSPARLRHARHFAGVDQFAQTHATQAELAEHGAWAAATLAARVAANLVLRLLALLLLECLSGHCYCPSRRNGKWKASRSALPSALVRAVVTIVMSMPRE